MTIVVSLLTKPKAAAELEGLVYGFTSIPAEQALPLCRRPMFAAALVAVVFVCLNLLFW